MSGEAPQGLLPASDALAEASVESLSYYFSLDPLSLSDIDLSKLVEILRRDREKRKLLEGLPKPAAARKKPATGAMTLLRTSSDETAEDLGL